MVALGTYDQQKSYNEKLKRFLEGCAKTSKRPEVQNGTYKFKAVLKAKKEEDTDPLMTSLTGIVNTLKGMEQEALRYEGPHINQDFRRIYASSGQLQLKLDRTDIQGRDEAKQLKRAGLTLANKICDNILMSKIHPEDFRKCDQCLKIQ